jgi:GNAT superfamily N-acetyltransferase
VSNAGAVPQDPQAMPRVTRLSAADFPANVAGLADLLTDSVTSGASLGFLAPFDRNSAADWWLSQAAAVADGSLIVWVSWGADGADGTVSLVAERKPNGSHRAYVVKLMVHRRSRGQGLGRKLLATAEQAAAEAGVSLLLLDTETGSQADNLYRATGWTAYGVVPRYATDPAGVLRDCTFFYKAIGRRSAHLPDLG